MWFFYSTFWFVAVEFHWRKQFFDSKWIWVEWTAQQHNHFPFDFEIEQSIGLQSPIGYFSGSNLIIFVFAWLYHVCVCLWCTVCVDVFLLLLLFYFILFSVRWNALNADVYLDFATYSLFCWSHLKHRTQY